MPPNRYLIAITLTAALALPLGLHLTTSPSRSVYEGLDARGSIERSHVDILFVDRDPLAVAFLGLSSMWVGVDARSLQEQLSETGETNRVALMGANHPGEDLVYSLAQVLLENREVSLLVLSTPGRGQLEPHPMLHRLYSFKHHQPVWEDLSWRDRITAYGLAVLGAPGQLLARVRQPVGLEDRRSLTANNGSWLRNLAWPGTNFAVIETPGCCTDMQLFLPEQFDELTFDDVTTPYQRTYLEHTLRLAEEHGTRVAILSPPLWRDRRTARPIIRLPRELLEQHNVPLIAQSGEALFGSAPDSDIQSYFYNANHMNPNGTSRVTGAIAPHIRQLLAAASP